jgi:hypothetical protein
MIPFDAPAPPSAKAGAAGKSNTAEPTIPAPLNARLVNDVLAKSKAPRIAPHQSE